MNEIPTRDKGYSVESGTAIVHERYQDHAPNAHKVRSLDGAYNVAKGQALVPCPECFSVSEGKQETHAEVIERFEHSTIEGGTDAWVGGSRDWYGTTTDSVTNAPTETVGDESR